MDANAPKWSEISSQFSAGADTLWRPEMTIEPVPAPARLATHTAAALADLYEGDNALAEGKLVVLFEPTYQPEWDGNTRLVGFIKAELETELVTDSLLLEVGWSWVTDSFAERGLHPVALSGTVSRTGNQSFGDISSRPPTGAIELRSSWTVPGGESVTDHFGAWIDLLAAAGGLPPLPSGVGVLPRRKHE